MTIKQANLSRRAALKGAAGLVIALTLPLGGGKLLAQSAATGKPLAVNAYVRIGSDDIVTVIVKHLEMGQGPLTGLSTLVAEELDADWSKIRTEHAPVDATLYAGIPGIQMTGGSNAIATSYDLMRRAGATARAMLVQAAALAWKVKPEDITVSQGVLRHAASQREGRFGQFAEAASKLAVPQQVTLKDPANFQLIGKDHRTPRVDALAKSTGKAKFTLDINAPGMLTVVVAHPDRFGAKLASFDASAALKVNGVVAVKPIPSGVAVYAKGMWAAIKGRKALKITWDESGAETRGTEQMIADYRALAATPGVVAGASGDAAAAFAAGGKVIEAEYVFPYLAHAPMEPLDGYLQWDGTRALARYGCQAQTFDQGALAMTLGLAPANVEIETLIAGGSFGRRAQGNSHFALELAEAAKAIGPNTPIKLVWTREDDIRGGYYRPLFLHRMRGVVRDGQIAGWTNTLVGQSFMRGTALEPYVVVNGVDMIAVEGANNLPYDLPAFRCEAHFPSSPVSTLWWRSVGHTHAAYSRETFIDRLLIETGKDPVAGRLELMGKHPRLANVLKAVAELANWSGSEPAKGRARGVAVAESFGSYVAEIAEVSLGTNGEPKVHKVWCAVDCGVAVNPDVIRAQVEGGIGFALGHALYGEVPLEKGAPTISNFDGYRSLRIEEMPAVELVIIKSDVAPTGIGEPPVPPLAPAVANALAQLGKARPTRLPFVRMS
jgi:isoquinoline 1-oxidoreductase beta subunit